MSDIYFFGDGDDFGRCMWAPGMIKTDYPFYGMDGCYVPTRPGVVNYLRVSAWAPGKWTVLSMQDNTIYSSGGSHATFVLRGEHSPVEAIQRVKEAFPEVVNRIGLIAAFKSTRAEYEELL